MGGGRYNGTAVARSEYVKKRQTLLFLDMSADSAYQSIVFNVPNMLFIYGTNI